METYAADRGTGSRRGKTNNALVGRAVSRRFRVMVSDSGEHHTFPD